MPMIIDRTQYINANFTAAINNVYATRCDAARVVTLPSPATVGTGIITVIWAYGASTLQFVSQAGSGIYTTGDPFGNSSNVGNITYNNRFDGHVFTLTSDGANWLISVGGIDAWLPLTGGALTGNVTNTGYFLSNNAFYASKDAGDGFYARREDNNSARYSPSFWMGSTTHFFATMRGYKQGQNGPAEAYIDWTASLGGWSTQTVMRTTVANPPGLWVAGDMSASSVTNRSDAALKSDFMPLPQNATNALLALPITTYMTGGPDLEEMIRIDPDTGEPYLQEARINPARRRHVGFVAQELRAKLTEALGDSPVVKALVFEEKQGPDDPDLLAYDVGGMLSLCIATIQKLAERIKALEDRA